MRSSRRTRRGRFEQLESRELLTSVPFGASSQDTAEFMIGDVTVNVVLLESNGAIDDDTEQWTPEHAAGVKANIEAGLQWWTDTLALHSDVHSLNFNIDYTYADDPVEISYEPISRGSQDFTLWMEEFFRAVDVPPAAGFDTEIREFNHRQRLLHDTNWSFTIFVVNVDNDPNDRFGDENAKNTVFTQAFAYAGGRFLVMPHTRPAGTVAHEVGHMFWAYDEYSSGEPYSSRRGYYGTQNTNGAKGNPEPHLREPSIMASTGSSFTNHRISQSAREMIGWKDSDGDGIFDVLDVAHALTGEVSFDEATQTARFIGTSSVQTLENQNTEGTGNDMTLNRITGLQYRLDEGPWLDLVEYDAYDVEIDATTPLLPSGTTTVEFRTIDGRVNVTSGTVKWNLPAPVLQNPENRLDVSGDGFVSPIDVLRIIVAVNSGNVDTTQSGPPYLDVSGDSFVTPIDALIVINFLNQRAATASVAASEPKPPTLKVASAVSSAPIFASPPTLVDQAIAAVFAGDEDDEHRR